MRRILLVNAFRTIQIDVPLFRKIKAKIIKQKQMRGKRYDILIFDEGVKLK